MTFAQGLGVLALLIIALPVIQGILTAIGGPVDDIAAYILIFSWVVSAFTGRQTDSPAYAAILSSMEAKKYMASIDAFVKERGKK